MVLLMLPYAMQITIQFGDHQCGTLSRTFDSNQIVITNWNEIDFISHESNTFTLDYLKCFGKEK